MSWISKGPAAEVAVEVEAAVEVAVAVVEAEEVEESLQGTKLRGRPALGVEAAPCLGPDSDY